MNLTQRDEYRMAYMTVFDYLSGADQDDAWPEGVKVVTSTADMPPQDMLRAQLFAWFINTWHVNGISQWYSRYLRKAHGISYEDFYGEFYDYLQNVSWWLEEQDALRAAYSSWMTTGSISMEPVRGVKIHGWNLIHLSNLRMHADSTHGQYLRTVAAFVEDVYGDLFDDAHKRCAIKDLRKVSDAYLIRHDRLAHYPLQLQPDSNVIDMVLHDVELTASQSPYSFEFPDDSAQSLSVFMQNIYYARRRNFGKARIQQREMDTNAARDQ